MNELVTQAVKDINTIKASMVKSGNDISRIVYGIRDELKERNACRDFGLAVGMSKASISKMVTAETYRAELGIADEVSYNTIYKVKDLFGIDVDTTVATVYLLNQLQSECEIRNLLCDSEDTTEDTAEDTTENTAEDTAEDTTEDTTEDSNIIRLANEAKEIKSQVFDILSNYDISKEDMKLIKMLMQSLR